MELGKLNEITEFTHKLVGELHALYREHLFPRELKEVQYFTSVSNRYVITSCDFSIFEQHENEVFRVQLFLSDEYSVSQSKQAILSQLIKDMPDILWYIYSQELFIWDADEELAELSKEFYNIVSPKNYKTSLREYLEKAYSIITGKNIGA